MKNINVIDEELASFYNENFGKMTLERFYTGMDAIASKAEGYPLPNKSYNQMSQVEYDKLHSEGLLIPSGLGVCVVVMDDDPEKQ